MVMTCCIESWESFYSGRNFTTKSNGNNFNIKEFYQRNLLFHINTLISGFIMCPTINMNNAPIKITVTSVLFVLNTVQRRTRVWTWSGLSQLDVHVDDALMLSFLSDIKSVVTAGRSPTCTWWALIFMKTTSADATLVFVCSFCLNAGDWQQKSQRSVSPSSWW